MNIPTRHQPALNKLPSNLASRTIQEAVFASSSAVSSPIADPNAELQSTAHTPEALFSSESQVNRLPSLLRMVIESCNKGVLVMTPTLDVVYANPKAKLLCEKLQAIGMPERPSSLPNAIVQGCQKLIDQKEESHEPLVIQYLNYEKLLYQLQISWLSCNPEDGLESQDYLLVFLENCDELIQERLWIEQKKYQLTDREAEIRKLLILEHSYEEIAATLQISLNTVKTHVKNMNSKRKNFSSPGAYWYSR